MNTQLTLDLFPVERKQPWGWPYEKPCPLAAECYNCPTGCSGDTGCCSKAIIYATGIDPYRYLRSAYENCKLDELMGRHGKTINGRRQ